jgi:hypothetical protein
LELNILSFVYRGLIGSILGGFAYDRFNKIFMFMLFVWGMGVAAGVTPWCYNFVAMLLAHVMHGICAAAIDTGNSLFALFYSNLFISLV